MSEATAESPAGHDLPDLSERWQRAFRWIEHELGGKVVAARRQARWRPAWFIDLDRDGERVPLYFRGQRREIAHGFEALEFEAGLLRTLEAEGIPVPHVHGLCPEPGGIVMDRSPGRANLLHARDEAERRDVLAHYMDILARMHALDPAAFDGLGLRVSEGEEALGLGDFASWVKGFRAGKARPEPEIEFLIRWLHRNVPRGRSRASFVCADAGQFLYDAHRVTALIDFELAYIGDPAADLGALRCRDLSEPLGDLAPAIERYEATIGERIPRSVIDYHTVRFATCTPLAVAPMVARAVPGLDFMKYLSWYVVYLRTPFEVIAERMDLTLESLPELAATPSRQSPGHAALAQRLEAALPGDGDFGGYERASTLRLAQYLDRADRMAPALERANLDDLERLLGRRPASAADGDAALEAFVMAAPATDDAKLIEVLHRRLMRQEALIEPLMEEFRGVRMQSLGRH
jgi:aminoglycoside phosphotransferase (APT) family kinase protein